MSGPVTKTRATKIPAAVSRDLRALAHDLSNSLETIVQASYLICKSELPPDSRRWAGMLDEATHEAVRINRKLRDILRTKS